MLAKGWVVMEGLGDIANTTSFYKEIFVIIFGLAIAEAFRQFVAEDNQNLANRAILWDRAPGLISFLLLIFPFFQGMLVYFHSTYATIQKQNIPHYAIFFMFDGLIFTLQAAIFYILSRALSILQWQRFYFAVLVLLVTDFIWCVVSVMLIHFGYIPSDIKHVETILTWSGLDIVSGLTICLLLVFVRKANVASYIGLAAMFIRTILDYSLAWNFYWT